MKNTRVALLALFWGCIILCLVVVVLYETEVLLPGALEAERMGEYHAAIVMEIVTIFFIPLALRMFKFGRVKEDLARRGAEALRTWGIYRILMLTLPMMVNTILYYQFMNTTFGYMGIIGLLCLAFVYPSLSRCNQEVGKAEDGRNLGDGGQVSGQ